MDEIFARLASENASQLLSGCESLAIDIERELVTVTGERDIGEVAVKAAVGEDIGAIDRRTLRLVDGDRVAVRQAVYSVADLEE